MTTSTHEFFETLAKILHSLLDLWIRAVVHLARSPPERSRPHAARPVDGPVRPRTERHPLQRHGLLEVGRDLLLVLSLGSDPAGVEEGDLFLKVK